MVTASAPTTRVAVTVTAAGAFGVAAPVGPGGANSAVAGASNAIDGGLMSRIVAASYRPGPRPEKPIPPELTVCPRCDNAPVTRPSGILGTTLSDPRSCRVRGVPLHHALRSSVTAALAAALAVTPLGARAESNVPVTLRTGQSVLVATPRLTRVAVGDGKIAGVLAVGNSEIVINGRSAGRTTLLVWTNGARRTFDVTVTEQSLASLKAMLQGAIPDRDVHVDAYDHSLVLNGTVANGESL